MSARARSTVQRHADGHLTVSSDVCDGECTEHRRHDGPVQLVTDALAATLRGGDLEHIVLLEQDSQSA